MKRHCCHVDQETEARCDQPAEWEIWNDPYHPYEDNTDSCTAHVGAMLTDAKEHKIYHIEQES
jgi:hypothetical protein